MQRVCRHELTRAGQVLARLGVERLRHAVLQVAGVCKREAQHVVLICAVAELVVPEAREHAAPPVEYASGAAEGISRDGRHLAVARSYGDESIAVPQ